MLFGTFAQKNFFEYPAVGTYRGTVINANMAAHAPAGLAAFLLEKTAAATYIIDPLTHAFQHAPDAVTNDEGEPKASVRSLADAYGEPVCSRLGAKPVLPSAFKDKAVLQGFTKRCIDFQRGQLTSFMENSDAAKYLGEDEAKVCPYAVVAPYFFMTEATVDDWLAVNCDCAAYAAKVYGSEPSKVFASVVIDQGILLDDALLNRVTEDYRAIDGIDGFLVWIDGLDEQAASSAALRALLSLGRALRQGDREVINLHGGYFSVLAAGTPGKGALTGVTHAPEFGEHRGVVPVGGGIPIARYYVPDLHVRVRYRDTLKILGAKGWLDSAEAFHANVCNCDECKEVLDGEPANFVKFGEANTKNVMRRGGLVRIAFPTKAATDRCLRHYLQRKKREYHAAGNAEPKVLLENLMKGVAKYEDIAGLDGVKHLKLWHKVLSEKG
jgi:hypothetical protein